MTIEAEFQRWREQTYQPAVKRSSERKNEFRTPSGVNLPPILAQIPLTVRLQLLAERFEHGALRVRYEGPHVGGFGVTEFTMKYNKLDIAEMCQAKGVPCTPVNTPAELKREMVGEVVEIKCTQLYVASAHLKSQNAIAGVQAFSDKLRVLLRRGWDVQEMTSFLESKGVKVMGVRKVPPNLEDVFVSRLGQGRG